MYSSLHLYKSSPTSAYNYIRCKIILLKRDQCIFKLLKNNFKKVSDPILTVGLQMRLSKEKS